MCKWLLAVCAAAMAAAAGAADAPVDLGPVLERGALVREVLSRNPRVDVARSAAEAAAAHVAVARALEDPMVGYEVAPLSIGSGAVPFGQGFKISQRVPYPGTLRLRGSIAEADRAAADRRLEEVQLDLAQLASHLYDRYWLVDRALAVTLDHIALLQSFQEVAAARYSAGVGSLQAPLLAETEAAHLHHRETVLSSERRQLTARLNALLHRPPASELPPAPTELPALDKRIPALDDLIALALDTRPEVAAHRHTLAARSDGVALERLAYRPDFEPMASYNSMWRETEHQWMVGAWLRVPLQRKRIGAAIATAEARRAAAEATLDALFDAIGEEVAVSMARVEEAHHVTALFEDRVLPAARDQIAAARAAFETGELTLLPLIDAERSLRTAEFNRLEARANLYTARAALDRALGRAPFTDAPLTQGTASLSGELR